MSKKKAVVLLSGGLDSATSAAVALDSGFTVSAMTFSYTQKHQIEVHQAKKLAAFFNIKEHIIVDIPANIFRSALIAESGLEVPKNREVIDEEEIPLTYVPARNILFLSYALAFAESIGAMHIFIGANAVDYSGYPDCRPEFFKAYVNMANVGTKAGIEGRPFTIETPLIDLKKSEIIKLGTGLHVDYSLTHSCYDPDNYGIACGACDSCLIRKQGFADAGIPDPIKYNTK